MPVRASTMWVLLLLGCNRGLPPADKGSLAIRVVRDGERYRAFVTCPPHEKGYRFFLFQGSEQGTTTSEILDASQLECANQVPLGSFTVKKTGPEPAVACFVRIDNFFVTLRSLPRESVCQKLE